MAALNTAYGACVTYDYMQHITNTICQSYVSRQATVMKFTSLFNDAEMRLCNSVPAFILACCVAIVTLWLLVVLVLVAIGSMMYINVSRCDALVNT